MRKHWTVLQQEKIDRLNKYADALEKREKHLLESLAELSRGVGIEVLGRSWDTAMKNYASDRIQKAALIRIPERPYL